MRDITPTLREAFRLAQVGSPGPVFVELPVDILYPYSVISEQFNAMNTKKAKQSLLTKLVGMYSNYCLNHIFADAWKEQEYDPLPVSVKQSKPEQLDQVADMLRMAKRPLMIVGSQAVLRPHGPNELIESLEKLNIPVYLNGAARGLMGDKYGLQFRHSRKDAVREADLVILAGAICDFRLSYGRIFKPGTKVVSINRSLSAAKLNARIFWRPTVAIESDVAKFVIDLTQSLKRKALSREIDSTKLIANLDQDWLNTLRERDSAKDDSIEKMSQESTDKYINPLKLLLRLRRQFKNEDTILVADGGDFVASASYIMKPCGPLRWLDPGPFGTLGCGAGFALAAKLLNPNKTVLALMGDGAFGYAVAELDTFVRHKLPVIWTIGNDACWTQIVREQVPMLGSPVGCELAYTDYHKVADGFGARGYKLDKDEDLTDGNDVIARAKHDLDNNGQSVVVNCLIGKTKFRDGSISV